MSDRRVLVTGAGGRTGRAVLAALVDRGARGVALVRGAGRVDDLDVAQVHGDQRRVDDLVTALAGVDAVYAIAPNMSPHELAMARTLVDACHRAGVQRLVQHSVVHPQLTAMPHHADKARAEELVLESGLRWTILQPNAYLQNLDGGVDDLRAGRHHVPYAADAASAMVDVNDVAEVAARCLVDDLAVHATLELSGPAEVSPADVAATAGELLGHAVTVEHVDPDAHARAIRGEDDPDGTTRMAAMFRHYDQHGSPGDATVLTALLGRPPVDLRTHLARVLGPGG